MRIEVLVGRVRRKLGSDMIETRRGFGYLVPEPAADLKSLRMRLIAGGDRRHPARAGHRRDRV